jgi:hypothetical protein
MTRAAAILLGLLGAAAGVRGDTLIFPSGGEMKGVVLSKNDDAIVVRIRHGLMTLNPSQVASIEKSESAPAPAPRLAPWDGVFGALRTRPWGPELRPVTAVIIDSGLYKYVPYTRDVSGGREFSLYGDPDAPAAYEIGLVRSLAGSTEARKEAAATMAALLTNPKDRETLASLALSDSAKAEREGLTFEVEKGTNAEGMETWWLSVYNEQALDAARISEKDLPKPGVAADPSNSGRGTTIAEPKASSGKGEPQGTISPFGREPDNSSPPPPRRRNYSTGGINWSNWWNQHGGGHPTTPPKPTPHK